MSLHRPKKSKQILNDHLRANSSTFEIKEVDEHCNAYQHEHDDKNKY